MLLQVFLEDLFRALSRAQTGKFAAWHQQPTQFRSQPRACARSVSFYRPAAQIHPPGRFLDGIALEVSQAKYLPGPCRQPVQRLVQQSPDFRPDDPGVSFRFSVLKCDGRFFDSSGRACIGIQRHITLALSEHHNRFVQADANQPGGQLRLAAEL